MPKIPPFGIPVLEATLHLTASSRRPHALIHDSDTPSYTLVSGTRSKSRDSAVLMVPDSVAHTNTTTTLLLFCSCSCGLCGSRGRTTHSTRSVTAALSPPSHRPGSLASAPTESRRERPITCSCAAACWRLTHQASSHVTGGPGTSQKAETSRQSVENKTKYQYQYSMWPQPCRDPPPAAS